MSVELVGVMLRVQKSNKRNGKV